MVTKRRSRNGRVLFHYIILNTNVHWDFRSGTIYLRVEESSYFPVNFVTVFVIKPQIKAIQQLVINGRGEEGVRVELEQVEHIIAVLWEEVCQFGVYIGQSKCCLLYTSPSPRDATLSRMPSSA